MKALREAGSAGRYLGRTERRMWEESKMTAFNSTSSDKVFEREAILSKRPVLISVEMNRSISSLVPGRDSQVYYMKMPTNCGYDSASISMRTIGLMWALYGTRIGIQVL